MPIKRHRRTRRKPTLGDWSADVIPVLLGLSIVALLFLLVYLIIFVIFAR